MQCCPLLDHYVKCCNCRYSEFETLFGEIKKKYPSRDKLVKLPGKKVLKSKFDPNLIDERRIGLHDFIINLMNVCFSCNSDL